MQTPPVRPLRTNDRGWYVQDGRSVCQVSNSLIAFVSIAHASTRERLTSIARAGLCGANVHQDVIRSCTWDSILLLVYKSTSLSVTNNIVYKVHYNSILQLIFKTGRRRHQQNCKLNVQCCCETYVAIPKRDI